MAKGIPLADGPRTLAQIREELDPQGDKVDKDEIIGLDLIVNKVKPWKAEKGMAVRVVAVVVETGQRVWFNGGDPMYNSVSDFLEEVPFIARVKKVEGPRGRDFYVLE